MKNKPNIVCMGILNTKGEEIRFLAGEISNLGAHALIMDLSLGDEVNWADIPLEEVLKSKKIDKEKVFRASRAEAVLLVGSAGAEKIQELYKQGKVDGVISWAGCMGTTVATMVMRALPIGVPKIMMSTVASSDVRNWLGNKDIYIVNPIAEQGINKITRMIVGTAAAAIVSMAEHARKPHDEGKPMAAITAYGTTFSTVKKCSDFIKLSGWDTIIFHQTGSGATMEDLIRSGHISALFDVTTAELSNTMFDSPYGLSKEWQGERLTAAAYMGIPQVVCPGGLDQFTLGPIDTVPEKFLQEYRAGRRISHNNCGKPYVHNLSVTTLNPTIEETENIALYMIEKLNRTKGPTVFALPMRGWSSYDQSEESASLERGWAKGNGAGPVWWPDEENPKWSKRATSMWSILEENADKENKNLDILRCDMHLLDDSFVDLITRVMSDMLNGAWKKGMYRDVHGVIK
jgi:uncharacterized protein (UPF0261 family)